MHETDTRLIASAKSYVTKLTQSRGERLRDAIEGYEIACRLARGADAGRSTYWSEEAAVRKNNLKRLVASAKKATAQTTIR